MKALAAKVQGSAGLVRKSVRRVVSPMRAGQRVQRAEIRNILREPVPQAKLPIGPSRDKYEREADAVADRVLRMPEPPGVGETDEHEEENGERSVRRDAFVESAEAPEEEAPEEDAPEPSIQRAESMDEEAEPEPVGEQVQRQAMAEPVADEALGDVGHAPELDTEGAGETAGETAWAEGEGESSGRAGIQRKAAGDIGPYVSSPNVAARITSPGSGRALPSRVRGFMEPRMGYRFAQVRLHDTSQDRTDVASLRARAFTYRNHIWLGKGQSVDDRRLMAHELAHVVQQRAAVQRRALVEAEPEVPAAGPETEKKTFLTGLKKLVGGVVEKAKDLGGAAKQALLEKLAGWAHKIPGFHSLTVLLGRNPVTGEAVERTPPTFIGAFLRLLPGGERLFENLQRSGALERSFAWLSDQIARLNLTWNTIRALFQRFFASLGVRDFANPPGVIERLKHIFGPPLVRIRNFAGAVGTKVLELTFAGVLSRAGGYGEKIMAVIRKAGNVFHLIVSDPIGFLKNLVKAVQLGFTQFMGNIWTHLKTGLLGWLFGALQNAGLKLPEKLDLKGILSIVLQVLGLTYAYLRKKLVKLIGEKRVRYLEKAFEFVKILVTKGLMAAWNKLLEYMGSLWDTVIGAIRGWVVTKIVKGAIAKLVTMFNPVGAIIQAIITVYNTIAFFIERMNQIMALANAVFDSIANIALGKLTAAANYVEKTMARTVPLIIGFLARLIGLGGIAERIKGIIEGIHAQVDKAIDKVVGFIVKKAKALFGKTKEFGKKVVGKVLQWWKGRKEFTVSGEKHAVYFEGEGANAKVMLQSTAMTVRTFLADNKEHETGEGELARLYGEVVRHHTALETAIKKQKKVKNLDETTVEENNEAEAMLAELEGLKTSIQDFMAKLKGESQHAKTEISYGDSGSGEINADGLGRKALASPLTIVGDDGDTPKKTTPIWEIVRQRMEGSRTYYVRGHLINDNLHGPGNDNRNLTPISQQANKEHNLNVEETVKDWVWNRIPKDKRKNPMGKAVWYGVEAKYESHTEASLEDLKRQADAAYPGEDQVSDRKRIKQILKAEHKLATKLVCEAGVLERKHASTYVDTGEIIITQSQGTIYNQIPEDLPLLTGKPPRILLRLNMNKPGGDEKEALDALMKLKGIGPHRASLIYNKKLKYDSWDDFKKSNPKIPSSFVDKWQQQININKESLVYFGDVNTGTKWKED